MTKRNSAKRTGRPPFEPTNEQRKQVQRLKLLGTTHELVAAMLDVSLPTLRKHFHHELEHSTAELLSNIAAMAYQRALAGDGPMIQFILRTKGGWIERKELTGLDGAPLVPSSAPPLLLVDFSGLDDGEPEVPLIGEGVSG